MSNEKKDLPVLHEDTIAMKTVCAKALPIDKKTGPGDAGPEVYEQLAAAAGWTKETLTGVQAFNTTFFAASTLAAGEEANKVMAKNKDLNEVVVNFPMTGKDSWQVKYTRSKEVSAGIAKEGEVAGKKTVFGSVLGTYNVHGVGKVGEMSKVKQILSAAGAELFS